MTRKEKYKLIELLEKLREKLCREPEEVYDMDDGDRLIEGLDIVLGMLE